MYANFLARPESADSQRNQSRLKFHANPFSWSTWFTLILIIEVLAVAAFQSPLIRFDRFAVFDSGGELVIQDLMSQGYRPSIDFGYLYGLLPLLVGRIWYGLVGLSPNAFWIQAMACMMLTAWGMARFAANRRLSIVAIILIAAAIPDLLLVTYIGLVQSLEQALLVNALAEHSRGRRGVALALLAMCCFVKPSLAVVQGIAVLIAIAAVLRRAGVLAYVRALLPAFFVVTIVTGILLTVFGAVPLYRTILPQTGMTVYQLGGFGFFRGIGRDFWALPHAQLRDYFRYELGFWMLGTTFLTYGALTAIWRVLRRILSPDQAINDEICLTCMATHIGFVVLIFGHRNTWFYSLPMLIFGLTVLAARGPWHRRFLWVLVVLLLISDRSKAVDVIQRWKTESPSPVTLNLWANPQEQAEWTEALQITRGKQPVLLAMCEGGALLIPGFAPPVGGYFVPGNALPAEIRCKTAQLNAASMIISAQPSDWPGFIFWPEMKRAIDGCQVTQKGQYLRVYNRLTPAKITRSRPDHE